MFDCIVLKKIFVHSTITGAQFVMKSNVIYLKIQQGILTDEGTIDKDSIHWKPIEPCSKTNLQSISPESGILLGDIEIPGHHLIGFKIMVHSGPFQVFELGVMVQRNPGAPQEEMKKFEKQSALTLKEVYNKNGVAFYVSKCWSGNHSYDEMDCG